MRQTFSLLAVLSCLSTIHLQAQVVLAQADFNDCALPAGWAVVIDGNQDADWYVGQPQSTSSDGSTIDGSCMIIIDDDATGDNTTPYVWHLQSPILDASEYTTLNLNADLHFRNADAGASLSIEVRDATGSWRIVKRFSGENYTGVQFSDFGNVSIDLSIYASPNFQVRFSYDDNSAWAWWAGADNILITAEDNGTQLLAEPFDGCALPADWTVNSIRGIDDWQFGRATNSNLSPSEQSINGSCMAFFDDDALGEDADPSTASLYSPWLDLVDYAELQLSLDFIFRRAVIDEQLAIYLDDGSELKLISVYSTNQGGPGFDVSRPLSIDISTLRSARARLVFEYSDGGGWGWYAGIDNVLLIASGSINDQCSRATPLLLNTDALAFDNTLALSAATVCDTDARGTLWYRYSAQQSGSVEVAMTTDFNDQLSVLLGNCASTTVVRCHQRDEHGFGGESLTFTTQAGEQYFIKVSGSDRVYGQVRGQGSIALRQNTLNVEPPHQTCADALVVAPDVWTPKLSNLGAQQDGLDTTSTLVRHTQYVQTTIAVAGDYLVETEAAFAAELTAFTGDCNNAVMGARASGNQLLVSGLAAGERLTIRIAANFATLEADWRMRISPVQGNAPAACVDALTLTADNWTPFPLFGLGSVAAVVPSCARVGEYAAWYRMATNASGVFTMLSRGAGSVRAAIYEDDCTDLTELACERIPDACDEVLTFRLSPNQTYLVRLSSPQQLVAGDFKTTTSESTYEPLGVASMVVCAGDGTGELQLGANGGVPPYTYFGAQVGEVLMNTEIVPVLVRDAAGCEAEITVRVECAPVFCGVEIGSIVNNETCGNSNDGSISLEVDPIANASIVWSDSNSNSTSRANLAPGTYTATVSLPDGCVSTHSFVIRPAVALLVAATLTNLTDVQNGSIDLRPIGGTGRYTYAWENADGTLISSQEDIVDLAAGKYYVTVIDQNGCVANGGPYELIGGVGTSGDAAGLELHIYPNPTSDLAILRGIPANAQELQIAGVDIMGRSVQLPWQQQGDQVSLDFRRMMPGAYQVIVEWQGGKQVMSVVRM